MKALLVSLSLFGLSLAGCDKHSSQEPAATSKPNALEVTKVTAEPAAAGKTATAPTDEKMSCGDGESGGATCGGEAEGEGAGCSQWDDAAAKVARRGTPADAVWTAIPVKGMSCGGCERRIVANLGAVDGIVGVEADAELGQVRVAFARVDEQLAADVRARIAALGYQPQ
jgi:copper chaperone CopZ